MFTDMRSKAISPARRILLRAKHRGPQRRSAVPGLQPKIGTMWGPRGLRNRDNSRVAATLDATFPRTRKREANRMPLECRTNQIPLPQGTIDDRHVLAGIAGALVPSLANVNGVADNAIHIALLDRLVALGLYAFCRKNGDQLGD